MVELVNENDRPVLGITIGDPAGIGPEITVKALFNAKIYEKVIPLVYADKIVLEDALKFTKRYLGLNRVNDPKEARGSAGIIDFIEAGVIKKNDDYALGEIGEKSGEASFQYIETAIKDAMAGKTTGVVTCPVSKEAINLSGHKFAGHTEIFAHYTNTKEYAMLLSAGRLNVIHVTSHVSLREACDLITKERVLKTIHHANKALKLMGKGSGRIAVAGLNPHASENSLFGSEEKNAVIPAIEKAKAQGLDVFGPLPADTVFAKALGGQFDIVVAMYHDQGHIPLKLIGFSADKNTGLFTSMRGVNATIGLPIIRTSVDHGTAFDIAGKDIANEESLLDAVEMAVLFAKNSNEGE